MLRQNEDFFAIFFVTFRFPMDKAYEVTQDPNLHVTLENEFE